MSRYNPVLFELTRPIFEVVFVVTVVPVVLVVLAVLTLVWDLDMAMKKMDAWIGANHD